MVIIQRKPTVAYPEKIGLSEQSYLRKCDRFQEICLKDPQPSILTYFGKSWFFLVFRGLLKIFLSFKFSFKELGLLNARVWYKQLEGLLTQNALVSCFKEMFGNDSVPTQQCFILKKIYFPTKLL